MSDACASPLYVAVHDGDVLVMDLQGRAAIVLTPDAALATAERLVAAVKEVAGGDRSTTGDKP